MMLSIFLKFLYLLQSEYFIPAICKNVLSSLSPPTNDQKKNIPVELE